MKAPIVIAMTLAACAGHDQGFTPCDGAPSASADGTPADALAATGLDLLAEVSAIDGTTIEVRWDEGDSTLLTLDADITDNAARWATEGCGAPATVEGQVHLVASTADLRLRADGIVQLSVGPTGSILEGTLLNLDGAPVSAWLQRVGDVWEIALHGQVPPALYAE